MTHNQFNQPTALDLMDQLILNRDELAEIRSMIVGLFRNDRTIVKLEKHIMSKLSDALDLAEANAQKETDAEAAIEKLVKDLSEMVRALPNSGDDPALVARVNALADGMAARSASSAAAVVAGTPAATGGSTAGNTEPQ